MDETESHCLLEGLHIAHASVTLKLLCVQVPGAAQVPRVCTALRGPSLLRRGLMCTDGQEGKYGMCQEARVWRSFLSVEAQHSSVEKMKCELPLRLSGVSETPGEEMAANGGAV